MAQRGPENVLDGRFPAERRLRPHRPRATVRHDLPWIPIAGQRRQLAAHRPTQQPLQRPPRGLRHLADGEHAHIGKPRPRDRAHAPHQLDRQIAKEIRLGPGRDDDQPVGLGHLRDDFREVFGLRDTQRDRQSHLRGHAPPNRLRHVFRQPEEMDRAGDVGKGLVDRDPLDRRREIAQYIDGGITQPLVVLEVATDELQFRAELARPPSRHPTANPESPGLVGSGKHDPATDGDGPAAQRRVEQLLDRGVEGVQVLVEDGGHRRPAAGSVEPAFGNHQPLRPLTSSAMRT